MIIYWSKKPKNKDQVSSDSDLTNSSNQNELNNSFFKSEVPLQGNDCKLSSFLSNNDYDSGIYDFISKASTKGDSISFSFEHSTVYKNLSDFFPPQNIDENNYKILLQLLSENKENENIVNYLIDVIVTNIKEIIKYDCFPKSIFELLKDRKDKKELIYNTILKNTYYCFQSSNGCKILIELIRTQNTIYINQILFCIFTYYTQISCGKYSSLVIVELYQLNCKCITDQLNYLLSANFQQIFRNKYGNSVVMKAIELSEIKAQTFFQNEITKINNNKYSIQINLIYK